MNDEETQPAQEAQQGDEAGNTTALEGDEAGHNLILSGDEKEPADGK